MIGRRSSEPTVAAKTEPKGFDDFELQLGDVMRGERATMGKSLLDVQRELRIKAAYIAAIENCDPSAFDTPGFIAGYVRSYARYLEMDPDQAFETFCRESGFTVAHGMSAEASVVNKPSREQRLAQSNAARDPFSSSATAFVPAGDPFWSKIEPGAVGSTLVLFGLLSAIGFGGWSVLKEVQRVQYAPIDQTPVVLSDLDPLNTTISPANPEDIVLGALNVIAPPSAEALDRLYRPQALDVPVLVARDAPISTLDPDAYGAFSAPEIVSAATILTADAATVSNVVPQVVEGPAPALQVVAVRPSWVRVRSADGTVIFEGIMESGETYVVPSTEEPPILRVGESGAIYFAINGQHYGPVGQSGTVTSNVSLSIASLSETFSVADMEQDLDLAKTVAELQSAVDPVPAVQE